MDEQIFKQGATLPKIGVIVQGLDLNPTGKAAAFYMRSRAAVKADDTSVYIATGTAIITDITVAGGVYSCVVTYQWETSDTAAIGDYYGEFKIDFGSSVVLKLPQDSYIPIRIINAVES